MDVSQELMMSEIANDLTSGAAELALRSINIFRNELAASEDFVLVRESLQSIAQKLFKSQPAMAPLFNLGNVVLFAADKANNIEQLRTLVDEALTGFESRLCDSAAKIADTAYELIPPGAMVFAYSFSSTVVSALLNARSKKKFFRVVCTESRPSEEGRKLANMLDSAGLEVVHTFDSAMGLVLPTCSVAFMGVDCVARPGIVNKVGSWLLALACRELNIPLYALAGTEKFVTDDLLFSFEDHERPGSEVWSDPPAGTKVLNRQFELIPFPWISGLVTEQGILKGEQIEAYVDEVEVHRVFE
ncbi:MAG: hypothetical protein K2W82_18570 [Candidatus Obscuribacterales bacterium]|nr:hypothetical protein [Candidatus Obscuribacterales bacterium]